MYLRRVPACRDGQGEQSGRAALFYYGRLALYLGVLVLVKSIGFVWALFGLLFLALYQRDSMGCGRRRDRQAAPDKAAGKSRMRHLLMVAAVPLLTGGSWMMFCLLMRRITKTTATAVKYMTTDEYGISGYAGEFAAAFLRAFVGFPLHKDKTPALDLTPLGLYLCICLLVVLFYRVRLLPEKTGRAVLVFCMVSGAVFYGIIFLAHITIFATETQYLEPSGMISSIERYGAPFTIGTLLFLAGIWLSHGERFLKKKKYRLFEALRRLSQFYFVRGIDSGLSGWVSWSHWLPAGCGTAAGGADGHDRSGRAAVSGGSAVLAAGRGNWRQCAGLLYQKGRYAALGQQQLFGL